MVRDSKTKKINNKKSKKDPLFSRTAIKKRKTKTKKKASSGRTCFRCKTQSTCKWRFHPLKSHPEGSISDQWKNVSYCNACACKEFGLGGRSTSTNLYEKFLKTLKTKERKFVQKKRPIRKVEHKKKSKKARADRPEINVDSVKIQDEDFADEDEEFHACMNEDVPGVDEQMRIIEEDFVSEEELHACKNEDIPGIEEFIDEIQSEDFYEWEDPNLIGEPKIEDIPFIFEEDFADVEHQEIEEDDFVD